MDGTRFNLGRRVLAISGERKVEIPNAPSAIASCPTFKESEDIFPTEIRYWFTAEPLLGRPIPGKATGFRQYIPAAA